MSPRLASLLGRLYRAMSSDARPRAAMRIWHPTGGQWSIRDATLTLQPLAEPRPDPTIIPLAPPATLASIAAAVLAAGWRVDDLPPELRDRGAIALLDQEPTTTGYLIAHDSLLWAIFTAYAAALDEAASVANSLPAQVRTDTATGPWPDYHGEFFGVPRLPGEPDDTYTRRIVAEVLRPKSNNIAMAGIISRVIEQQASVIDVTSYGPVVPSYDGTIDHDGTYTHNASEKAIKGLFDVIVPFDLLGNTDPVTFQAAIIAQVERLRAAGTHLRDIVLAAGGIFDTADGPEDGDIENITLSTALTESAAGPADTALPIAAALAATEPADGAEDTGASITQAWSHTLNGTWTLNGTRPLSSGELLTDAL
jgi:hypothetical protein